MKLQTFNSPFQSCTPTFWPFFPHAFPFSPSPPPVLFAAFPSPQCSLYFSRSNCSSWPSSTPQLMALHFLASSFPPAPQFTVRRICSSLFQSLSRNWKWLAWWIWGKDPAEIRSQCNRLLPFTVRRVSWLKRGVLPFFCSVFLRQFLFLREDCFTAPECTQIPWVFPWFWLSRSWRDPFCWGGTC